MMEAMGIMGEMGIMGDMGDERNGNNGKWGCRGIMKNRGNLLILQSNCAGARHFRRRRDVTIYATTIYSAYIGR